MLVGEAMILVIVQLYRYRRVSSLMQRQQTKWVVFGFAVPLPVFVGGTVLALIFPALDEPGSLYGAPYQLAVTALNTCTPLLYGALTLSLTGVYVGLVIGLSALLRGIISQDNSVAIVLSTLAIAALFTPLRQGIQRSIDRRFYRRKYDAAKTLAAFSSTLRQEVDLDQLREQLLAVAQETMQPAHVSLWLRKSEQTVKYKAIDAYTAISRGEKYEHEHLSGDDEPGIGPRFTERER